MKTRSDFVTNSSSSSFVLTIFRDKDEVITLLNDCFCLFKEELVAELEARLESSARRVEEVKASKEEKKDLHKFFLDTEKRWHNSLVADLKRLNKINEQDFCSLITFWLERMNGLKIKTLNNRTEISGSTTMYNSADDIPSALRTVVTELAMQDKRDFKMVNTMDN